jgi:OmpA-OmpF porin, OOP family
MAYNLIENLNTAVTNANLAAKMGVYLGEDPTAIKAGLDFAIPTLVGFMAKKSVNIEGAGSLLNVIRTGNHTGNILNTLPSLFDGRTNMRNYTEGGSKTVQIYINDDVTKILDSLNKKASFKKDNTANILLNLTAPIVLSAISKQITLQDLPVSGLRDFMKEQNGYVSSMLPKGIAEILGVVETEPKKKPVITEKTTTVKPVKETVAPREIDSRSDAEPFPLRTTMVWLIGICAVIGLGYGAWKLIGNAPKSDTNLAEQIEKTATSEPVIHPLSDTAKPIIAPSTTPVTQTAAGVLLADGVTLNVPKGSFEEELVNVVRNPSDSTYKNRWFILDRLPFDGETANLKPEALAQLQNLAAIMKAYPRVSIKIGGFLDIAGQKANPKLASLRSISVFRELLKFGALRKNLRADGYGSSMAIASNDTEEGRAKNRRVAIIVKTK